MTDIQEITAEYDSRPSEGEYILPIVKRTPYLTPKQGNCNEIALYRGE
jgi:hypothetical protein